MRFPSLRRQFEGQKACPGNPSISYLVQMALAVPLDLGK